MDKIAQDERKTAFVSFVISHRMSTHSLDEAVVFV